MPSQAILARTALAAVIAVVAGCGAPATAEPASPSPTTPAAMSPAAVDRSLLVALPPTLDGVERRSDAQLDLGIASSPGLAALASGVAGALYVDPATGDFASVSVIRLRAGTIDDATYGDWRDTFDAGACERAGGVARRAQIEAGGRAVFVATCTSGVRTYHVVLVSGLLVSVSSLGARHLGERLVAALGP